MLSPILIPEAKPTRKVKGYQMAETKENLVSCVLVAEHLSRSRHDWTSTVFLATRMSSRFGGSGMRTASTLRAACRLPKGSPYIYVQPKRVLAWDGEALTTMTRWVFDR